MDSILGFFLQDKPARILLEMSKNERTYPADISKALAATYSHIVRVIQKLEAYGLVESEKEGRTKFIKLTETGQQVAHNLEGLEMALKNISEERERKGRKAEKLETEKSAEEGAPKGQKEGKKQD
jgi:DNA-binding MarR family transcriptional regulator